MKKKLTLCLTFIGCDIRGEDVFFLWGGFILLKRLFFLLGG